jgi:urea transport system permease protein
LSCLRLAILLLVGLWSIQASAQDVGELIRQLADSDPKSAIEALTKQDDPKAKAALEALVKGQLFRRLDDGVVVIGEPDGKMIAITNAETGEIESMVEPEQIEAIALDENSKTLLQQVGIGAAKEAVPLDFSGAVKALNAESFDAKRAAITSLTALGDGRAIPVLRALADGRLFARKSDGLVVIGDPAGNRLQFTDATTLKVLGIGDLAELEPVFINNNLRNVVSEAVGKLGLLSAEAAQRRGAADALIGNATPDAVGLLRKAFAEERNSDVRSAMALAIASAEVASEDKGARLAAVDVLAGSTDLRVRSLLQGRLAAETDPTVRAAVQSAFDSVQRKLEVIGWAANLFQGISLGSVLLLAAIGLAITFGVMGVINMAHGEMIMLGAYTTYVTQEFFRAFVPQAYADLYLLCAVPAGFVVAALAGILLERGVIRFLYGRALETLLATWGVSLILQQLVRSIFGANNKEVSNPSWMTGGFDLVGGFTITWNRLVIILFCFLVLGAIALILRRTSFGLHMRAVTQNRDMAAAMGIPTARIDALTFGLGSGVAGMAGVALSQIGNVSPNLGQIYIVDSFLVVVFGGVGSLAGTLVGAMSLGIVNKFLEPVAGAVLGKVAILIAIILFIQRRPRGLFALKGRAADA